MASPSSSDGPTTPTCKAGRLAARVRRQFEALHPRRVTLPRQMDGADLDFRAVLASLARLRATGQGWERIHLASRATERDLAVALLVDCSRSAEASTGVRSVMRRPATRSRRWPRA